MMRRLTCIACIALAIACVLAPGSFADPIGDAGLGAGALGMGQLSDRYESINELGNSLTNEESVVIATRVGVLASGNRALNDSDVSFEGEAVNDILNAGDGYKWLNVRGTSNADISVYADDELAKLVVNVGDYHTTGTNIKVTGTYHIACPEHEGELDVHASSVEVIDAGGPITHLIAPGRIGTAFVLCAIAIALFATFLIARHVLARRATG